MMSRLYAAVVLILLVVSTAFGMAPMYYAPKNATYEQFRSGYNTNFFEIYKAITNLDYISGGGALSDEVLARVGADSALSNSVLRLDGADAAFSNVLAGVTGAVSSATVHLFFSPAPNLTNHAIYTSTEIGAYTNVETPTTRLSFSDRKLYGDWAMADGDLLMDSVSLGAGASSRALVFKSVDAPGVVKTNRLTTSNGRLKWRFDPSGTGEVMISSDVGGPTNYSLGHAGLRNAPGYEPGSFSFMTYDVGANLSYCTLLLDTNDEFVVSGAGVRAEGVRPALSNYYSLGTPSMPWSNVVARAVYAEGVSADTSTVRFLVVSNITTRGAENALGFTFDSVGYVGRMSLYDGLGGGFWDMQADPDYQQVHFGYRTASGVSNFMTYEYSYDSEDKYWKFIDFHGSRLMGMTNIYGDVSPAVSNYYSLGTTNMPWSNVVAKTMNVVGSSYQVDGVDVITHDVVGRIVISNAVIDLTSNTNAPLHTNAVAKTGCITTGPMTNSGTLRQNGAAYFDTPVYFAMSGVGKPNWNTIIGVCTDGGTENATRFTFARASYGVYQTSQTLDTLGGYFNFSVPVNASAYYDGVGFVLDVQRGTWQGEKIMTVGGMTVPFTLNTGTMNRLNLLASEPIYFGATNDAKAKVLIASSDRLMWRGPGLKITNVAGWGASSYQPGWLADQWGAGQVLFPAPTDRLTFTNQLISGVITVRVTAVKNNGTPNYYVYRNGVLVATKVLSEPDHAFGVYTNTFDWGATPAQLSFGGDASLMYIRAAELEYFLPSVTNTFAHAADLEGSIVPVVSNYYNLGSTNFPYSNVYAHTFNAIGSSYQIDGVDVMSMDTNGQVVMSNVVIYQTIEVITNPMPADAVTYGMMTNYTTGYVASATSGKADSSTVWSVFYPYSNPSNFITATLNGNFTLSGGFDLATTSSNQVNENMDSDPSSRGWLGTWDGAGSRVYITPPTYAAHPIYSNAVAYPNARYTLTVGYLAARNSSFTLTLNIYSNAALVGSFPATQSAAVTNSVTIDSGWTHLAWAVGGGGGGGYGTASIYDALVSRVGRVVDPSGNELYLKASSPNTNNVNIYSDTMKGPLTFPFGTNLYTFSVMASAAAASGTTGSPLQIIGQTGGTSGGSGQNGGDLIIRAGTAGSGSASGYGGNLYLGGGLRGSGGGGATGSIYIAGRGINISGDNALVTPIAIDGNVAVTGNVVVSGVVTASQFSGSGTALTGVYPSSNPSNFVSGRYVGTNTADFAPGDSVSPNAGFIADTRDPAATDSSFILADGGTNHWAMQTYRGENGQFWYLYNYELKDNPLTVSSSGRVGINKAMNLGDYHTMFSASYLGQVATRVGQDDFIIGGTYTGTKDRMYAVIITATNAVADTFTLLSSLDMTTWSTQMVGTLDTVATNLDRGVTGIWEAKTGHTPSNTWFFPAHSQMPGASLTVSARKLNECVFVTNMISSSWFDRTLSANSTELGIFPMLQSGTNSACYFGVQPRLNSLYFNLCSNAVGTADLVIEYWNGASWTRLTAAVNSLSDGTTNLTRSGNISWNASTMQDWTYTNCTVSDYTNLYYWLRMRSTNTVTSAPWVTSVTPHGNNRLDVYLAHDDLNPALEIDAQGQVKIGSHTLTESILSSFEQKYIADIGAWTQTVAGSGAAVKVLGSNELSDVAGVYSNDTCRWYPGTLAMCRVTASVQFTGPGNGETLAMYMYENGILFAELTRYTTANGSETPTLNAAYNFVPTASTNYYELYVTRSAAGGTVTLRDRRQNRWSGERLQ